MCALSAEPLLVTIRSLTCWAVAQILDAVQQLKEEGWEYELEASFIEVYNETFKDLLAEGKGRDVGKITDQNAVKHGVAGALASSSVNSCWQRRRTQSCQPLASTKRRQPHNDCVDVVSTLPIETIR